jgi:hypothetical protein
MSKRCQGKCKRIIDEYYVLENNTIYCYDCWRRELDRIDSVNRDNYLLYQEDLRRHREKEIQLKNLDDEISNKESSPEYRKYFGYDGKLLSDNERPANYEEVQTLRSKRMNLQGDVFRQPKPPSPENSSYLENSRFLSREMAKIEEEEERRKQEEYEKKTISDAQALFETVKQQKFTPEIIEDVKRKIAILNKLVKTNSFRNSVEAIELMKEEYEWQYKNDKYMSALYNITETRHEFIKKREAAKKKAQELYGKLMQNKPVNNLEEAKIKINEIEKFLCNDTYNDYVTAISLLENKYKWQFNEKEHFYSTLFDIDTEREKFEIKRNNAIEEARIKKERQKEAARIEEERVREILRIRREKKITAYVVFYIGFVLIIIGIKTLFNTGHWFYGILVIVGFLFYAILGNNYLYWWNPSVQKTTWKNMTPNTKLKLIVIGIIIAIIFLIYMCSVA